MHHDKHYIHQEEEGHPSLELLWQYHENALPGPQSHEVEVHLLACAMCSDVVDGMALSGADSTKAAVADINEHIKVKAKKTSEPPLILYWQMVAAVLLIVCSMLIFVYYNYGRQQQEERQLAAEQEINSSMDLSLPPAPGESTATADSVEEPEPQNIALTPPQSKTEKKEAPPIVKRYEEILDDVFVEEENAEESVRRNRKVLEDVESPALAATPPASEETEVPVTEAVPFSIADAPAITPETTDVSRALQGKVAGVTIRGSSSLKNDTAAARVVSGKVLSEDGQPLPGVTVQLKGTGTGTTTDGDGNFALPVAGKKPTLQFNYIGYLTAEKDIAEITSKLNIHMAPDQEALSEVVVTGYGTVHPKTATAVVAARPAIGRRAFRKYLKDNLRFPAASEGERGKVVVGFTVTASGEISEVQVLKSLCPACDAEAMRLVKEGPAWKPATQAGKPVPQQVKVSVPFR